MAGVETRVLHWLDEIGPIADTDEELEQALAVGHDELVGIITSLDALEMIVATVNASGILNSSLSVLQAHACGTNSVATITVQASHVA